MIDPTSTITKPQEYPVQQRDSGLKDVESVVETNEVMKDHAVEKEQVQKAEKVEEITIQNLPPLSPASPTTVVCDVTTTNQSFQSSPISSPTQSSPIHIKIQTVDDDTLSELPFEGGEAYEEREATHPRPFTEPPLKYGWVKKQADHMKTWRQRYVVLYNGYLLYYAK